MQCICCGWKGMECKLRSIVQHKWPCNKNVSQCRIALLFPEHSVQLSPRAGNTSHSPLPLFRSHLYIRSRQSRWCESRWKLLMVTRIKRPCHPNYFLLEFNNKHVAKTDYERRIASRKSQQLINR